MTSCRNALENMARSKGAPSGRLVRRLTDPTDVDLGHATFLDKTVYTYIYIYYTQIIIQYIYIGKLLKPEVVFGWSKPEVAKSTAVLVKIPGLWMSFGESC